MSFTLSKLKIQKKISALFIGPSAIQPEKTIKNLNVGTAVAYLADAPEVPIEVAEDEEAKNLLGELAVAFNRTITYGVDGLKLVTQEHADLEEVTDQPEEIEEVQGEEVQTETLRSHL